MDPAHRQVDHLHRWRPSSELSESPVSVRRAPWNFPAPGDELGHANDQEHGRVLSMACVDGVIASG